MNITHYINHDLSMQLCQIFGCVWGANDNRDVCLDGWDLRFFKVQIFGAMSLRGHNLYVPTYNTFYMICICIMYDILPYSYITYIS